MTGSRIRDVHAWEVLDSRGDPTVACEVVLAGGARGTASVPSGASTGRYEARELRDGGARYGGRGVARAVANVRGVIRDALVGLDASDGLLVDTTLRRIDGTPELGRLGANAVLSASVASALAGAAAAGVPLHRWLAAGDASAPLLPMPMVNVISGGAHAGRLLDVQDFLVVPVGATSFAEAIEWSWRVRSAAQELVAKLDHVAGSLVADEGGLSARLASNRAAAELVATAIERSGLRPGVDAGIAIDVAANQLLDADGRYRLAIEDRELSADALVGEMVTWSRELPIISIEDVLADDDRDGWRAASRALGHLQLVGDDLFATHLERLEWGIQAGVANAVLVKPNQVGTLSDAAAVVRRAQAAGYATVVSARSGETEDAWLADLAVGWRAGQIKVGSTTRSERTAKWNRLLRIEATERGARFAGGSVLAGRPPVARARTAMEGT